MCLVESSKLISAYQVHTQSLVRTFVCQVQMLKLFYMSLSRSM